MRILVLNYEYPPLGGGAGVATAALARGLAERGVKVDVVTASAGRDAERRTSMRDDEPEDDAGLRLYRVRSRRTGVHEAGIRGAASYLVGALPLVRRLIRSQRYDCVHVFFSLPTGALLPFVDLGNVPVVVSLRGSDVPGYDPYNPTVHRMHRLLLPLTRWIWRRADRLVAVCESLVELASQTCPELRYAVVPNGVDLKLFHPPEVTRPARRRLHCLAVARLIKRKGLGDLIRAFALLEPGRFDLEIVGDGPDERVLRELASHLGVGEAVRFLGSLDRAAVAQRYREADLFTLPSSAEAFGNVFAEALASGLPIVGSTAGGIPELVDHGTNGLLVSPGNPNAVAQAIRYLAGDPELCKIMSARNRAKAEAMLQWSKVTERYVSIYETVAHKLPAPSLVAEPTVSAL